MAKELVGGFGQAFFLPLFQLGYKWRQLAIALVLRHFLRRFRNPKRIRSPALARQQIHIPEHRFQ
jgi:hypothetical protein